jgi:hypothetical protein
MAFAVGDERSPAYAKRYEGTDEEKAARMSSITVNTGTYSVSGVTATLRPMFALVPEFVGGSLELDYEFSDDALTLKWRLIRSADGTKQPFTAAGNSFEVTLVRIQSK